MSGLLQDKTGLILGVSNNRGIAWAIAQEAAREGARLILSYADDRLEDRARQLADEVQTDLLVRCDLGNDEDIAALFETVEKQVGRLDFVVHSVAFAKREELAGEFVATSREGFALAHDISTYSLVAVARGARPYMTEGGSLLTVSFQGSQRVFPNYNVMGVAKAALEATVRYLAADLGPQGIRVNAVSPGPIRTLAASAVRGLGTMQQHMEERAPLRRNITAAEVAAASVFLLSDKASGITGEVLHVDAGYHIVGL
ncbi:MAG TPA: enoyl-ACP reductase [Sphingobacteriaceae bacterium]|nr:enoyl-ACP reductase [Sphingobacteriaceae bacterium]